jgi:hypothetical protein
VSRSKGNRAPGWLAAYLLPWFPTAEPVPNGRPGRDVLGTPGIAFEVKTTAKWSHKALAQAARYAAAGELAVVVYYPPGCGEGHTGDALAILPVRELMPLAVAAGYAPAPRESGDVVQD